MSSKFSLRGTRVQKPPKVCKSARPKPPLPAICATDQVRAVINCTDPMPPGPHSVIGTYCLPPTATPGIYFLSFVDADGWDISLQTERTPLTFMALNIRMFDPISGSTLIDGALVPPPEPPPGGSTGPFQLDNLVPVPTGTANVTMPTT